MGGEFGKVGRVEGAGGGEIREEGCRNCVCDVLGGEMRVWYFRVEVAQSLVQMMISWQCVMEY